MRYYLIANFYCIINDNQKALFISENMNFIFMYDDTFEEKPHREEFHARFGEWIECAKCRSLMFDTFKSCWSCGTVFNEKNKIPVRL